MEISFKNEDGYLTIETDSQYVSYLRYSTGTDVNGRNKIYKTPIWIGEGSGLEVIKVKGFNSDGVPVTGQYSYYINEDAKMADDQQPLESIDEESVVEITEIPEINSDANEVESELTQQPDLFDTDEFKSVYAPTEVIETEPKSKLPSAGTDKPSEINHAIENNKPNIVRIIFKIQLNAYDVSVMRAPTFMEEKYFYASIVDTIAKVTQFKPSEVKVEIGRFSTSYIKNELINKGYNVIYIT